MSKPTLILVLLPCPTLLGCGSAGERPPAAEPRPAAAAPKSDPRTPASAVRAPPSQKEVKARTLDELLLFYPSKYPEGDWKPGGLVFEDVWFRAADGTRLHGWFCPCRQARAALLFAHGNAGNLSQRSAFLRYLQNELRVTALIFDYRGYGRSEGVPTVAGILADARAARAVLARRAGMKESQVVLMGRSLGGAVVVQLASEVPPRALILESTFSSLREVASYHYPKLAWLVPADRLDSLAKLARYRGPLLHSHGDADRTIPYAQGLKLFGAASGPKQFVRIPGADHNAPRSAEYLQQLDRFIAGLPDGSGSSPAAR
jgi:fermentation-respiration switch protein FrsA (DUF1100 family)